MAKMVFVGIDDGHDSIKLTLESGKSFIIPARVSLGQHMLCAIAEDQEKDHMYKIDDNDFSVIDFNTQAAINYIDTRTQDYPYSKHNIALIYHALHKAGITGPVSIMTGLPVERFYRLESVNPSIVSIWASFNCFENAIKFIFFYDFLKISESIACAIY